MLRKYHFKPPNYKKTRYLWTSSTARAGRYPINHRRWSLSPLEALEKLGLQGTAAFGTSLSFEKEDYVREFSVAVPLASKKTFPQKATIMARTAQQSITVRFDDDSKNSWYSLEEA
jgi:hypothetical protein